MITILIGVPLPLATFRLAVPFLLIPAAPHATWVEREVYLMGTTLRVEIASTNRAVGIQVIEEVFSLIRHWESCLSTWRDDSEIMALNRAPTGRPVRLSPELQAVLVEAAAWTQRTGGAFDPAIGALVDAWDLRGVGRMPSPDALAHARAATGLRHFELSDTFRGAVRRDTAAWLDTGGFGKGVALREVGRLLRSRGIHDAFLNFGGQVLALGDDQLGAPWSVPVAHPSRRQEPVTRLQVRDASVSTSAQSERGFTLDGRRFGHILDPRSGVPVPAWGSVTVVAADPVEADILSTALLVLGPGAALRWAERRADVGVLVLEEREGRVRRRWNRRMERYLVVNSTSTRGG